MGRDDAVDVAIVGAGYTGLWTAYYLRCLDPTLRVAIVEAEIAGFGASGRNGGWCSALFAGSRTAMAHTHGRDAVSALQHAMNRTVDEVGAVVGAEDLDVHYRKGGTLTMVTSPAQLTRVRKRVAEEHEWGFGIGDMRWLDEDSARARVDADTVLGAAYTPHCARIHPARLARGLARVVSTRGAAVYERSPALAFEPGAVRTPGARLRAEVVVRATEAFTVELPGLRRAVAPVWSLMIATEPLPAPFWEEVGWERGETLTDGRNLLIYAQRTADDRIAFGGRGAPYHFGGRVRPEYERDPETFAALHRTLLELFPAAAGAAVTHRWGGAVAVPRDWRSSVGFDRSTGLAWAGGYVGDGVGTANLAGRTLADLILGRDTDLVRHPWVGHRSPPWEPEPLRWLGITLAVRLAAAVDRAEIRNGRPARLRGALLHRLTGH